MTGDRPSRVPLSHVPGPVIPLWRRTLRYWIARVAIWMVVRAWFRIRVEGRKAFPPQPAIVCFNHLNWMDPFILMATLPMQPRVFFFGPKEEDMNEGGRNRLLRWTATTVPYKPGKSDLLAATRAVGDVLAFGGVLAIAGEGRIHRRESALLPLNEGPAYFALRFGVPIVPVAINGTSWLRFGGRVRVRVGAPLPVSGRPTREAVAALTQATWESLHALVADHADVPAPGPVGRRLTELFNEWPEGARPEVIE